MEHTGEIIIYNTGDGQSQLEVKLDDETVWLNLMQLAQLFGRDKSGISRHIKNILQEGELEDSVVAKKTTTASDGKKYTVEYFNLDMIISVGYRVNSKRGTQFRIWATKTLRDHLVKGFAINEKRLQEQKDRLQELQKTVEFIHHNVSKKELSAAETKGLSEIISQYTRSFILLNRFDSNTLETRQLNTELIYELSHEEAVAAMEQLKKELTARQEASALFGKQKDNCLRSILYNIAQTFAGKYLYNSIEEQAAHLLYLIVKNRPFADGNKRLGTFLFVWFLEKNKHLLTKKGDPKINDNTLVALALLVAQSDPKQKELMIRLIINMINEGDQE